MRPQRAPVHRRAHRLLGTSAVVLVLALTGAPAADAASPASSRQFLVAADPAATAVYVYRADTLRRTGELDDVKLGSHVGTLPLDDGRLVFVDDQAATINAMRISPSGKPRVVDSVKIPGASWERAAWAATDARQRYFAVSSDDEGASAQRVTVVDLDTFEVDQITVPLTQVNGGYAETQVYLAGTPLQLVVTTGGKFETFPLAPILAGQTPTPTSSAPLGANNHGPVVAPDGKAVFSTTADGFDGASLTKRTLTRPRSVAYSPTRNVVQNYRPKLAADGRTVWGAVAEDTGLSPQDWADTRNDVNVIDTTTFRSSLVRLPDGLASQFALSARYGAVSTISPDGDALTLVDTNRRSPTYQRIVGTVALPSADGGPVAGQPTAGTQGHTVAVAPRGDRVFVSNGGDGEISVVNTSTRRLVRTISTPTALVGGGYLTVVQPGRKVTDLVAR